MILADWRDIAVIALAFFFTVQAAVVIVLVSVLIKLAIQIKDRMDALLVTTQGTMRNINGTATFVGDTVASPIIKGLSFASGVRKGVGAMAGLTRKQGR